jgi:L-histidine N-alpha-methyltransferase
MTADLIDTADDAHVDAHSPVGGIIRDLSRSQKLISPKYFYDHAGSILFEKISELPEYYLTRVEQKIMNEHLDEIAELLGRRVSVIEFGSGSSAKIRTLLDGLQEPAAYVPVDISADYLRGMAHALEIDYPQITIRPVVADMTRPFELPRFEIPPERNIVFFPGSTIGNFDTREARDLLKVMHAEAKPGGALLIGVDPVKDPEVIRSAYNDTQGVTAEFNLNILRHLNREFGADFELRNFEHDAIYDETRNRIEMRLVSSRPQIATVAGTKIAFERGEYIITEYSHKFSVEAFAILAEVAGFELARTWTDADELFNVHYLTTMMNNDNDIT